MARWSRSWRRGRPPRPAPVQQLSVDGAMVPLVGGQWAEVKLLALGTVTAQPTADGTSTSQTTDMSYYARLTDADTVAWRATSETHRRGAETAVAARNGYTSGGIAVTRDATGFPTVAEDDVNDRARAAVKDLMWTASGDALPASGSGAPYVVLLDTNATAGSRGVWAYGDLVSDRAVSSRQALTVSAWELRGSES